MERFADANVGEMSVSSWLQTKLKRLKASFGTMVVDAALLGATWE